MNINILRDAAVPMLGRPRISSGTDYLMWIVGALFAITLFMSVALVKFGPAGLPFRAFGPLIIIGLVVLTTPGLLWQVALEMRFGLAVFAGCLFLGIAVSLANGAAAETITPVVLEIYAQAFVGLLVGGCVARICGPRFVMMCFLLIVTVSFFVAALQFVGSDIGWRVRSFLQSIQTVSARNDTVYLVLRNRAMGLSFSPVHFGTQLCQLFAVVFCATQVRANRVLTRPTLTFVGMFVIIMIACIITGNRSPMLGMVAFAVIFLFLSRPIAAAVVLIAVLPFFVFVDDILDVLAASGWRVARTTDGSSAGRAALRELGKLLLFEQPFGWGFAFDSIKLSYRFWNEVKMYDNPVAVRSHGLHNYYLIMLNVYGLPVVLIAFWVIRRLKAYPPIALAFVPYAVHIYYHNDGPIMADFIIWFLYPSILMLARSTART